VRHSQPKVKCARAIRSRSNEALTFEGFAAFGCQKNGPLDAGSYFLDGLLRQDSQDYQDYYGTMRNVTKPRPALLHDTLIVPLTTASNRI
jgi:hypothetical protein